MKVSVAVVYLEAEARRNDRHPAPFLVRAPDRVQSGSGGLQIAPCIEALRSQILHPAAIGAISVNAKHGDGKCRSCSLLPAVPFQPPICVTVEWIEA